MQTAVAARGSGAVEIVPRFADYSYVPANVADRSGVAIVNVLFNFAIYRLVLRAGRPPVMTALAAAYIVRPGMLCVSISVIAIVAVFAAETPAERTAAKPPTMISAVNFFIFNINLPIVPALR